MEANINTLGVFLYLSKAFNKLWHPGLLWKLKDVGIQGKLFVLLQSYLRGHSHEVVLNSCRPDCEIITTGAP